MTNFLEVVIRGELPSHDKTTYSYTLALADNPAQLFEATGVPRKSSTGEKCLLCVRPENTSVFKSPKAPYSGDRHESLL